MYCECNPLSSSLFGLITLFVGLLMHLSVGMSRGIPLKIEGFWLTV